MPAAIATLPVSLAFQSAPDREVGRCRMVAANYYVGFVVSIRARP